MPTFNHILYVYSDSVNNSIALNKALDLAKENKAKLTVLFTITDESLPDTLGFSKAKIEDFIDQKEASRDKILAELSDTISLNKESVYSNSSIDVIRKVQQLNIDLLIKPSENEGILGKLFGSNDMEYLRQCPCPVWLINLDQKDSSDAIIAAVDVNQDYPAEELAVREKLNLDVLNTAASIAVAKGGTLKVVSVWSAHYESTLKRSAFVKLSVEEISVYVDNVEEQHLINAESFMNKALKMLDKETIALIRPEHVSIKGDPKIVLPEYAKTINADLVVMGTVARVGIPGLIIGNTAENILYQLSQSVLAIKPAGFTTLVK